MPNCPKCGSSRFHYELRAGGTSSTTRYYRTGIKKSWIIPSGRRSYTSSREQHTIGICPDCGYTERQQSKRGDGCATILGTIIILAIVFAVFRSCTGIESSKNSGSLKATTNQEAQNNEPGHENSIWASEYTPISDFKYYIDHDKIVIVDYRGRDKKVYVAPAYEVDGIMMDVAELEGVFALDNIESAIISHGIKKMESNIFNSCRVKYVFLPSSLEEFDGWDYFHEVERLYFEGTEDEFNAICDEERKDIDVTRIIFDASLDDLFSQQ